MSYFEELKKSMSMLSKEGYLFLGQSVRYPGNVIYKTLVDIPDSQKIEMPVAEEMQMGLGTGLSLQGHKVVSIFPRMDFLICAMNQLVNHLDKIEELSHGVFRPKVIIRTMVGSKKPLDAGLQHTGNYVKMLKAGLKNIDVHDLKYAEIVYFSYLNALESPKSSILVEYGELYD